MNTNILCNSNKILQRWNSSSNRTHNYNIFDTNGFYNKLVKDFK